MFTTIQKEENALRLFFMKKKILQGACADVFTRPTLLGFHANGRNFATSASIVVVPCKVTTLLGPTMLGVAIVGQQCCVRLHGAALGCVHNVWQRGGGGEGGGEIEGG